MAGAIRGFPGLGDRWESANAALEALRKSAQAKVDPPPPPGPAPGGKVGTLWVVSATYGIYVKLDPDTPLVKDDVLEVFRNGEIVGEIVVEKIVAPDGTYPNGSAACRRGKGAIQKGDEVRRKR